MPALDRETVTALQTEAELLVLACKSTRNGWVPGPALILDLARRIAEIVIPQDLKERQ